MKVEIWSDVVCPWCYIGKRRFEAALARFPHAGEAEVVWRSFELDPGAAPSTEPQGPYVEHLARKYGLRSRQAQGMIDHVTQVAAAEGLDFRFDLARRGNTFDAHRLLHLGLEKGVQNDLKERLDHATFTRGLSVSDHAELAEVALGAGLDEVAVKEVLTSDRFADAVRADEARARDYGISAVPFFVIDEKYGVAGAQGPDILLETLTRAWQERSGLTVVGTASDVECADGSCS
ncbi:MAG: DsbA family oxidoreductase [Actinomycetota bacterium]